MAIPAHIARVAEELAAKRTEAISSSPDLVGLLQPTRQQAARRRITLRQIIDKIKSKRERRKVYQFDLNDN